MYERTGADSEQKDSGRRLPGAVPSVDIESAPSKGAETNGAGYGYGYPSALETESNVGLVSSLRILYRRRYLAVSVFLVVVLSGALYTFTATPIYVSTVQLLIERDNPNVCLIRFRGHVPKGGYDVPHVPKQQWPAPPPAVL